MKRHPSKPAGGVELVNRQKQYAVRKASLRAFVQELTHRLHLEKKKFNICFVDDRAMRRLNAAYRGKDKATDVLSFGWSDTEVTEPPTPYYRGGSDLANHLGEVVISVEAARRNALTEGHSTRNEIRWLILHGTLHLLGYDHERDRGEMVALELRLREEFGISGGVSKKAQVKRQNANGKGQKFKLARF